MGPHSLSPFSESSLHRVFYAMQEISPAHLAAILNEATARDPKDAAVVATNSIGVVVYWNERAEALFGWRTDEALGRDILDVTPTRNSLDEAARILEQLNRGETWSGPFIVQRSDGTPILIDITNYPVRIAGKVVGIIGVSRRRSSGEAPRRIRD